MSRVVDGARVFRVEGLRPEAVRPGRLGGLGSEVDLHLEEVADELVAARNQLLGQRPITVVRRHMGVDGRAGRLLEHALLGPVEQVGVGRAVARKRPDADERAIGLSLRRPDGSPAGDAAGLELDAVVLTDIVAGAREVVAELAFGRHVSAVPVPQLCEERGQRRQVVEGRRAKLGGHSFCS